MILRIEDTDAALRKPEYIDAIVKPLQTLGIDWDEGPYYLSLIHISEPTRPY